MKEPSRSRRRRTHITRSAAILLVGAMACGAAPLSSTPAPAAPPGSLGLSYSIAFWGIPFGATNYEARFAPGGYAATSRFETSGIVSLFWQATIDASVDGHLGGGAISPLRYDSFYRRGSAKKERVRVSFNAGRILTFADPPYDTSKYPVSEAQKRDAVDPMSAIALVLTGLKADAAHPCGTVAPVFDGRRRYDIEFASVREEPVEDGALFRGTAHLCRLHYHQIAGFKPKILREGAAFPPIYGVFADIPAAGAPRGHYVVPLKVWAAYGIGQVSATLTRFDALSGAAR